jgi:CDP-glucose 4,6-dehydratase
MTSLPARTHICIRERTELANDTTSLTGRSVLVTGHTGFKGSWLALWLHQLGAHVTGYALDPLGKPNHFDAADVGPLLAADIRADIRDADRMAEAVRLAQPDVIFHLAAQPIVRASLLQPLHTFETNVVGTASLLDAVRGAGRPCAVVVVTSDKCYRNDGQVWGFRENDPLGGHDPYSASKAGTELVVEAYRSSFFPVDRIDEHGVRLASARAGNVIGGGDWADDRIVPDAMRALSDGADLVVRNPGSTRPWQHVLEPLSGYLALAEHLLADEEPGRWADAWNFGPQPVDEATVADLATAIIASWGSGRWVSPPGSSSDIEATTLRIAIDKAVSLLGWQPRWHLSQTVERTVRWYQEYYRRPDSSMREHSVADIEAYRWPAPATDAG